MPDTRFNPPIQIWACGVPGHRHLAKVDALKCQASQLNDAGENGGAYANPTTVLANATASGGMFEKAPNAIEEGRSHGAVEYADLGHQADGKQRYPIDTEKHIRAAWDFINRPANAQRYSTTQLDEVKARIIAAWKEKIDKDGPPLAGRQRNKEGEDPAHVALVKALWDVGRVARIIIGLDWLKESLSVEAAMEGDNSPQPLRLQAIIGELCDFLNARVVEETSEILDETEIATAPDAFDAPDIVIMAAGSDGAALLADLCASRNCRMQKFASALLAKAKHNQGDQALLDLAYYALDKCMRMNGLLFAERSHVAKALEALKSAGAGSSEQAAVDTSRDPSSTPSMAGPPALEFRPHESSIGDSSTYPSKAGEGVLEIIAAALGKRGSGPQALMNVAHDCIGKLTDEACCAIDKLGARHSRETLQQLADAHDHLVAAGAECNASSLTAGAEWEGTEFETRKVGGNMAKLLFDERAEKAALIATLTDIVPRLDQLTKRVEDIARTPLPALAMSKSVIAISKQQDSGVTGSGLSPDEFAAAFSRMSKEEQTLTLIKASYANPIHPLGLGTAKELNVE